LIKIATLEIVQLSTEDGASGVKLAIATVTVLNSSRDSATDRHLGPEEDLVLDPVHEKLLAEGTTSHLQ
jgi:hypothetical protein